jgi:hypothetical protein
MEGSIDSPANAISEASLSLFDKRETSPQPPAHVASLSIVEPDLESHAPLPEHRP